MSVTSHRGAASSSWLLLSHTGPDTAGIQLKDNEDVVEIFVREVSRACWAGAMSDEVKEKRVKESMNYVLQVERSVRRSMSVELTALFFVH